MTNKIRTFICFELPGTVHNQIQSIQEQLKPKHDGVRWVNPENIHLTLAFLGHIEPGQVDHVLTAVQTACEPINPFTVTLQGTGAFPDFKRPRVFWMGIHDPDGKLLRCHDHIVHELERAGFPGEKRSYSPHLTLGRVKNSRGISAVSAELESMHPEPLSVDAREVVVMQSKMHPSGAVYTPLHKITL